MPPNRCLSCPCVCMSVCPVLSVTFVYCGQTVRRIKMKLGKQVRLGPDHIVLDGDSAPLPQRGTPQFSAHICCGQMAAWYGVRPRPKRLCIRWGSRSPSPKRGQSPLPNFRHISIVAKRLDASRWHLLWRWSSAQATLF